MSSEDLKISRSVRLMNINTPIFGLKQVSVEKEAGGKMAFSSWALGMVELLSS